MELTPSAQWVSLNEDKLNFEVRMLCKLFIKGGQGKRDIRIVNSNLFNLGKHVGYKDDGNSVLIFSLEILRKWKS